MPMAKVMSLDEFLSKIGHSFTSEELVKREEFLRAKRLEALERGFIINLKTVPGARSFEDAFNSLPKEIVRNGKAYKKDILFPDGNTFFVQYRNPDCDREEGTLVSGVEIGYVKILAQQWFGMTYAGLDSFMSEFSKFIGVHLDRYNIEDHFNSFAAYMAKECGVEIPVMKHVLRHIFIKLK